MPATSFAAPEKSAASSACGSAWSRARAPRHVGQHVGAHLRAAAAAQRRGRPGEEQPDPQRSRREAPVGEARDQVAGAAERDAAARRQGSVADGDVAHHGASAVAHHGVASDQPRDELAVACVVLDRGHEGSDDAAARAQRSVDRREHERAAEIDQHRAGAQHAQADDVLVVEHEREHLGVHRRDVIGGDRGGERLIARDRAQCLPDRVAVAFPGVDLTSHRERGVEVGAVGAGAAARRGGAAARADHEQRGDRRDRRARKQRGGDPGALRHAPTP